VKVFTTCSIDCEIFSESECVEYFFCGVLEVKKGCAETKDAREEIDLTPIPFGEIRRICECSCVILEVILRTSLTASSKRINLCR
jgi:hypothetical protein